MSGAFRPITGFGFSMRIQPFYILFLMTVLALISLPNTPLHAQTAPAQQTYSATLLDNNTVKTTVVGKSYILQKNKTPLDIRAVEDMIRSGEMLNHLNQDTHINLGNDGIGTWIVLPVANNTMRDTWTLRIGSFGTGRFSNLKDVVLYNMNSGQALINTLSPNDKEQNIPNAIQIKIPAQQTSFFILYLKPNIGSFSFASPSFELSNQTNFSELISSWLSILLSFSAFLYFIKNPGTENAKSHLYMAMLWLGTAAQLLLTSHFLRIGSFETELISPLTWIFISLMMIFSLMSIEGCRDKIPASLFNGLTSIFLISGLAGVIMLKSLPGISFYLIYSPIFFICLMSSGITCFISINERNPLYFPLACTGTFIAGVMFWTSFLYFGIIPATPTTVIIPQILITLSVITTVTASMLTPAREAKVESSPTEDVFANNHLAKKDIAQIAEAKEKSEHRRLMQVIEQERHIMSELQVKSAKQNEDMRRSKEAADEANRAKSAFLAIVSHEIRTPMTGIMGMLRLLQDTQLSKDQKEYAMTIKDSGDAMLALLNDILDFEKIESGKMDLENISFDLKRLIKGVHTLMRGHAEAKNIDIILDIDSTTPTWVYGDPTRLRQVLLNLINNAIKFTSKGNIYLRVRDLTGDSENKLSRTHQIYFAIQDSGIGISPEGQKKLFMPFAQADSSISRKYGGTGLGLAICKRLIEAMGGAISISSKENEGTTFFFTLSIAAGQENLNGDSQTVTDYSAPLNATEFKSPLNILVVDDNGINLKVVSGFIEKLGASCMTASSGADALETLARYPFDAILMDLQLPDMTGIEVTEHIRKLSVPSKANIPIIALTGNTDDEDKKSCFDAGMNDFATKPITFEKVSELLHKVDDNAYSSTDRAPIIDFVNGNNLSTNQTSYPKENDFISDTDTSFLDRESIGLNDDEDTFALAVQKFEEMEKSDAMSGPWTPSSQNPVSASLEDMGLDESLLKSLRNGLSIEQIQEILVSFYEKADELISEIGTTYLSGDTVNLYARAHELKGMAGNFGFSELSKMCAIIEKSAKDGQLQDAKEPIDHLGDHYAVARTALNQWLTQK